MKEKYKFLKKKIILNFICVLKVVIQKNVQFLKDMLAL